MLSCGPSVARARIDPAATGKNVIAPAGFPLASFTVNGFQVVTIKPTA
jgi:hypothetical protein